MPFVRGQRVELCEQLEERLFTVFYRSALELLFDLFSELFRPPFAYAFCVDEVSCAASVCDVGGFYFAVLD